MGAKEDQGMPLIVEQCKRRFTRRILARRLPGFYELLQGRSMIMNRQEKQFLQCL
jgi:hypothetical protein